MELSCCHRFLMNDCQEPNGLLHGSRSSKKHFISSRNLRSKTEKFHANCLSTSHRTIRWTNACPKNWNNNHQVQYWYFKHCMLVFGMVKHQRNPVCSAVVYNVLQSGQGLISRSFNNPIPTSVWSKVSKSTHNFTSRHKSDQNNRY